MITGNEPVMPMVMKVGDGTGPISQIVKHGITIRQYFAAMAMQGLISNQRLDAEKAVSIGTANTIAWDAVKCADALINELSKPPQ